MVHNDKWSSGLEYDSVTKLGLYSIQKFTGERRLFVAGLRSILFLDSSDFTTRNNENFEKKNSSIGTIRSVPVYNKKSFTRTSRRTFRDYRSDIVAHALRKRMVY